MLVERGGILKVIRDGLKKAKESVLMNSAWIDEHGLRELFSGIDLSGVKDKRIVIRVSERKDLEIDKPQSLALLRELGFEMAFHPNLHAKFIVVDGSFGVVGSSNFTYSGLMEKNVEVDVVEDEETAEELRERFEEIWKEAERFSEDIVGITMNPGKSDSVEFLVFDEDKVREHSFVVVDLESGEKVLARVDTIMSYDTSFFMNPFTEAESGKFLPFDDLIFSHSSGDPVWKFAALMALKNSSPGVKVVIATAKVEGLFKDSGDMTELELSSRPIDPKLWVRTPSEGVMSRFRTRGRSVVIGEYHGTDVKARIDVDAVSTLHLSIFGSTGSGKSHFTKRLIERISREMPDVSIYVFDPHGEYAQDLSKTLGDDMSVVEFEGEPRILSSRDDVKGFLSDYVGIQASSYNLAILNYFLPEFADPDDILRILRKTEFVNEKTKEISDRLEFYISSKSNTTPNVAKKLLEKNLEKLESELSNIQDKLKKVEWGEKKVVVFNLKHMESPNARVNVVGYVSSWIFKKAKEDSNRKRILVVEEAHNFAPEKSVGDVTSGKSNPAYRMLTKMASEGRKFNIGLIVISQRPANVTKYMISQTNSSVIFRLVNRDDIDSVASTIENVSSGIVRSLPSLKVGEAFVVGFAFPIPALVKIV